MTTAELMASLALINRDSDVMIPARALVGLISFALAGPSNEASVAVRDKAVKDAHKAMLAAYLLEEEANDNR